MRWAFPAFAPTLVETLTVALSFPDGYAPADVSAWAWLGNGPLESASDNLIERRSCRAHELRRREPWTELIIHEPLPLYSYALVWTPLDRTDRIDAPAKRRR